MKSRSDFSKEEEYKEYLRAYFSGLAMQTLLNQTGLFSTNADACRKAVTVADELIKQLESNS